MKVAVKDLQPNPYRRMDKYPIDRNKVESLKLSIDDTSFWDNILARKNGEKFQIAYGHHRLIALQELGIKFVDIPVRDLTNAQMLKIMANENMEDWRTHTRVMNETVLATKEFLDAELAKHESWESTDEFISSLFEDERGFRRAKGGVGRDTILKFLNGSWKAWQIQEALSTLQDEEVDREAVEEFDKLRTATKFRTALKKHHVPKGKHKEYARKFKDHSELTIEQAVRKKATDDFLGPKKKKKDELPWVGEFCLNLATKVDGITIQLDQILEVIENVKPASLKPLARALEELCHKGVKIITRAED